MINIRVHPTLRTQFDRAYNEWVHGLLGTNVIVIEPEAGPGPLGTIEYLSVDPKFLEFLRGRGVPFAEF